MPWLKRNLWLVIGGVVAVGLLGFAGYFLFTKIGAETEVTSLLEAQTQELDRLSKLNPHPGSEKVNNIEAAKKQERELQEFVLEAYKRFAPLDYPKGLDGGRFKLLLDNTIDELQRTAERAPVKLPSQYAFTFAAQKTQMAFEADTLEPLTMAVVDIRAISLLLFQSKILTLDGIRRVAIATQDTPSLSGQSDYWGRKPQTNDLGILTPYEFTFHCFTPDLASVLEGLYGSPHGFIVKNIVVDTVASTLLEKEPEPEPTAQTGMGAGMNLAQMMYMQRYGLGRGMRGRMDSAPPPAAAPAPNARTLTPMLDEKPFRVILWVDVLRLKDPKEITATKPKRPPPPPQDPADIPPPGN